MHNCVYLSMIISCFQGLRGDPGDGGANSKGLKGEYGEPGIPGIKVSCKTKVLSYNPCTK